MNIIESYPYFFPAWEYGGVTRVVFEVSKKLVKRGHKVTVLTTDALNKKNRIKNESLRLSIYGIDTYYFRNFSNFLAYKYNLSLPFGLIFQANKVVKNSDMIHMHGGHTFQSIILYFYAQKYNIPYIIQAHGSLPINIGRKKFKQIFNYLWGNKILQNASKCIALTKTEFDQYIKMGVPEEKITVIPNGINDVSPTDLPPAGQFRERYDIHEKHIILYVGRIHKRKGIDFLIHAFNSFIQTWTGDDVTLVIVGPDDGYRSTLENLVEQLGLSEKARFIGYAPTLTAAYQDADVLVYPSIYEIFGLVPFEALLCGTPVIVTDDCGCGELIEEAECGYLVHYGDVAGLSETLRKALDHPDVNIRMVEAGRRYVEECLNWESVVKRVEEVYEKSINCK